MEIVVRASHLMEPNPRFVLVVTNPEEEVLGSIVGEDTIVMGYNKDTFTAADGSKAHGILLYAMSRALTPSLPLRMKIEKRGSAPINFIDVFHQKGEKEWVPVPLDTTGVITFKIS